MRKHNPMPRGMVPGYPLLVLTPWPRWRVAKSYGQWWAIPPRAMDCVSGYPQAFRTHAHALRYAVLMAESESAVR